MKLKALENKIPPLPIFLNINFMDKKSPQTTADFKLNWLNQILCQPNSGLIQLQQLIRFAAFFRIHLTQ